MTAIPVWDVLQRRKPDADWEVAGGIKAPDLEMAMLLARETHFRHKEAPAFAIRLRGTDEVHPAPDVTGMGGVIDRAYRRSEGYAGVGAKLKKVHALMKDRGLVIDRPRPPATRGRETEAAHG
jgi:1,2-phenylacetyl-CoA epoxidase PaaB subunit